MGAACQFLLCQFVSASKNADLFAEVGYDILLHGNYLGVNTYD